MPKIKQSIGHTDKIDTASIYQSIEEMMAGYKFQRRSFERRWYDNNFFDDGYHFRFISRKTGKIIDSSNQANVASPKRAIPKASRQIRGIANLLMSLNLYPSVYPERVAAVNYPPIPMLDPQTGQVVMTPNPEYDQARQTAKQIAQKIGWWIQEEWKEQDIKRKMVQMLILAAKHGVSYLQIWPDAVQEEVKSRVYDAFDIYLNGTLDAIYDSPSIIKAVPMLISEIKANEMYDLDQRMMINPDNKYASSEVKEAYMQSRFGNGQIQDSQATVILKEAYIKEYITEYNMDRIRKSEDGESILKGKEMGDVVIRQVFSTSNGCLRDQYLDLKEYPFVDFRYEPGLIYQVPMIERFIDANKSLDIAVSRVEGYSNTMVTGIYQKRKGEDYRIANIPGGQLIEYDQRPLEQMQIAPMPGFIFNFIGLLNNIIEEQGASAAALGKLPEGVKSGVAIESVKATEYANLQISTDQVKDTIKLITERLVDLAANYFIKPQEIVTLEKGEPEYFDIIGQAGVDARKRAKLETNPNAVVLKDDYHIEIEVESGLGYTIQGKKDTMQQIANYMLQLAEAGVVNKEQIQVMLQKFLEIFQFGSTQEFMDAVDFGAQNEQMTEDQIAQIKIAVMEVLKDTGLVGPDAEQQQVDATKVGVAEMMQEMGGAQ